MRQMLFFFLVGLGCFARPASASPEDARPNIITIVCDDLGWRDFSYHGSPIKTPCIDKLAAEGMKLERFYVNPICSLTRSSLMTGQFVPRTGVNNRSGLPLDYRIMPQDFRDAGYQTWMCGKWHLGGPSDNSLTGRSYHPDARGFLHFYGLLGGAIDYFSHINRENGEKDWWRNGEISTDEGYSTNLLAAEAIKLIQTRDKSKPFYLHLAFNAAHGPVQPPTGVKSGKNDYTPVVMAMDAAIGRVLAAIDEEKLRDNSVVLLFSDNGAQEGMGGSNSPLRGFKGTPQEGGIRSPAVLRYPPKIPAGTECNEWMWVGDVWPTLAAAAGITPQPAKPMDGINLWPTLTGGEKVQRTPFLVGAKDWAWFQPPWKLIVQQNNSLELFDIQQDPTESQNLASEKPELAAQLLADMRKSLAGVSLKGGGGGGAKGGNNKKSPQGDHPKKKPKERPPEE